MNQLYQFAAGLGGNWWRSLATNLAGSERPPAGRGEGAGIGAGWLHSRRLLGVLFLAAGLAPVRLPAQTNTAKAASSNRCLLIVDTSRAMQRRSEATLKVVQDLMMSGLDGQLQRGDSLGLWTFNEALYTGRFPLQTWSAETREEVAARTITFLKAQPYGKKASFDTVAPALAKVVRDSERLTVILISCGDETVRGTPFDKPINQYYRQWHGQQQKARMPFVTVLRAQNGQFADYTLNLPPWPVQIPRPPQAAPTGDLVQTKLREALRQAEAGPAAPAGVSAKTPPLELAPAVKPAPAPAKVETPVVPAVAVDTNQPGVVKQAEPGAPPAEAVKPKPVPVVIEKPVPAQPPKAAPALAPVAEPKVEPVAAMPEAAPLPPTPKPKSGPVASAPPKPVPAPEAKPAPSPAPPPSSPPVPPVQTATAAPAETLASRKILWVAALAAAVVAVGLAFLLLRRSRTAPQGSLITRSIERRKEP